jgi:NAD(P)-dependent dehydrogenase (short-subunit alcohol dehydrogenase family)
VEAELGPVSILVNNAGNGGPTGFPTAFPLFWQTEPKDWDKFFSVNLFGVMNCCRAVTPGMAQRQYGRIVTIVSDAGRNPEIRQSDYCAAKAGAAGFMRGLAADGGRYGITANSIALGTIEPVMPPERLSQYLADDQTKKRLSKYIVRRFGQPSDIAAMTLLLASDASSWITGQTYPVNGGYTSGL